MLKADIDPARAIDIVAGCSCRERRLLRFEIGRVRRLADLPADLANFFYGECMAFSKASDEVGDWVRVYFSERGGSPGNYLKLCELYEFYQALTCDVDIRYDLVKLEDEGFDVRDVSIVANNVLL